MAAARIAAVLVALLCAELSAQPAPHGNVTIQVTDTTGAVIPGARIRVDPATSSPGPALNAGNDGQAVFNLSNGSHVLLITSSGFEGWSSRIDVQSGAGQAIVTILKVVANSGPPFVGPYFEYDPDLRTKSAQSEILIPPRPFLNLDPLPLKSAKRRW